MSCFCPACNTQAGCSPILPQATRLKQARLPNYGKKPFNANKGITNISYNHLNLPEKITFSSNDSIKFAYTSTGAKLRKEVFKSGVMTLVKDYANSFVYSGNTLEFVHTAEGRAIPETDGSFTYEYYLKDHLGNTRVSFAGDTATVKQEDHYYPFGLRLSGDSWVKAGLADNKFLYNGKEFEGDLGLNWYDYVARRYDPQLGRWHSVDPMDEFWSPYVYVGNDPISRLDPDGMDDIYFNQQGAVMGRNETGFWSFDWLIGDNHFVQWDDGNISFKDNNYVGVNSMRTVSEYEWSRVREVGVGEFLKRIDAGISGIGRVKIPYAVFYYDIIDKVRVRSGEGGLMDFKNKGLNKNSLYVINGVAFNWAEAGNFLWGGAMNFLGFQYTDTRFLAHGGTVVNEVRIDEYHDNRAVGKGHKFMGNFGR